jgi:ubiquinone/menaquinone biosynthesis C-methylase UbiE
MDSIIDQKMLRDQQYKTPSNLQARIEIHRRFSRNPIPWFQWQYQALAIQPGETVLDLGCGPGGLWAFQRGILPADSRILLCDLSSGMVASAASSLAAESPFRFAVGDAQRIPIRDHCCDLVTANHMLYHVPDIAQAAAEIRRVLKPGGRLAAATNGNLHLKELYDLIRRFIPDFREDNNSARRFGLENGAEILSPFFEQIEVRPYEDSLWVTEVEPLLAYIQSMWGIWELEKSGEELLPRFEAAIRTEIDHRGGYFIQKSGGILFAR